jgi:hypothetical protein
MRAHEKRTDYLRNLKSQKCKSECMEIGFQERPLGKASISEAE